MIDPYVELGVDPGADPATIRARYLERVKQYPPEHAPDEFRKIRAAYEMLRDPLPRLRTQLFEPGADLTIEGLIEELVCQSPRRWSLARLKAAQNP